MLKLEPQWKNLVVHQKISIKDALTVLNKTGLKILLVTDSNDKFIGTVTDGDIRKKLLDGINLSSSVENVVHLEAQVVSKESKHEKIINLMQSHKINQVPIIDSAQRLAGMYYWEDLSMVTKRSNVMVIMAGGMGTRLRPDTETVPKPMLKVAGKPILEHIIHKAKSEGFYKFIISVFYLGTIIENYFKNGSEFGVDIEYLKESTPLGTAGSLSLVDPKPNEDIIVTNGDIISDISYTHLLDYHRLNMSTGTMAVRLHEFQNPFGVVGINGIEIENYEEKPVSLSLINAGVYVLHPGSLDLLVQGEVCDMPKLFDRLRQAGMRTIVYPIHEQWIDIGRKVDLQNADLIKQKDQVVY